MKDSHWIAAYLTALTTIGLTLASCSGKSFTVPRSEQIKSGQSNTVTVRSIEADREIFLEDQEQNQKRIAGLIKQRTARGGADSNYRVGPGDDLEISVFDVPELNLTTKVRHTGHISLPLLGSIQAVGLTEGELTDSIANKLKTYVRDPQVSIQMVSYESQKIAVLGAVQEPGTYALKKGRNSILELISEAGGISEKAGNYFNFVPREITGLGMLDASDSRSRISLGMHKLQAAKNSSIELLLDQVLGTSGLVPLEIPVRSGDMIIIPEAGKIMVEGEVQNPGSYDLSRRMSMISALASAGGITYAAKVDEVEVIREIAGHGRVHMVIDLTKIAAGVEDDVLLKNGDVVRIPSDSGRRLTQDTFNGVARLVNFGVGGQYNMAP